MKNLFTKLTITLMAAGTLFATTATASANTVNTPAPTTTSLVNHVDHETNLALGTANKPAHDLTPRATKLATKTLQSQILETVDTSSQNLDKMKYTK